MKKVLLSITLCLFGAVQADQVPVQEMIAISGDSLKQASVHQHAVDQRLLNSVPEIDGEKHMVIVVCSYNNRPYYKWNLDSVLAQNYSNYHILYVDDKSPDGTGSLVRSYCDEHNTLDKMILLENQERQRAMANLYMAISMCKPTDIIIILDGDDRFSHANVLSRINTEYKNPNIWLTYGQFKEHPSGVMGFCRSYPQHIVAKNGFRYYPNTPSHLRTFYAGLFHKIKKDDLMFQGDFFPVTYDLAMMFPMVEMSRTKHKFINEVLVDYNGGNPLNDHKVDKGLQRKFDLIIRARTCYVEVESPF